MMEENKIEENSAAVPETAEAAEPAEMEQKNEKVTFASFGLSPAILDTLAAKGFTEPTPVQGLTIPALLEDEGDLIARAETGTGKTAAYGLPIIESLLAEQHHSHAKGGPRALVLSPTRELAMQIAAELDSLTPNHTLKHVAIYGGQAIDIQTNLLRRGVDVVIGTPGRVIDLIRRGELSLEQIHYLVLDEADEMLDMGFVEDIETILAEAPEEKRMLMFSATMPEPAREIAERFMRDPEFLSTAPVRLDAGNTEQIAYEVSREDKLPALERVLAAADDPYAMVFCRTRADVDELTLQLQQLGFQVEALHGELTQGQRTRIINRFKARQFPILIATDVAARGIDVNDLTHVINYSLPQSSDIYVHRIGRTGRAGKSGIAITFVTPGERRRLDHIRKDVKSAIPKKELPDGTAVAALKRKRYTDTLQKLDFEPLSDTCLAFADELLISYATAEELVARMLQLRFGKELDPSFYPELGKKQQVRGKSRIRIGAGRTHGYTPSKLMSLIHDISHVWKSKIGRIFIAGDFSEVEIPAVAAEQAVRKFRAAGISCELLPQDPMEPANAGTQDGFKKKRFGQERPRGPHPGRLQKKNKQ